MLDALNCVIRTSPLRTSPNLGSYPDGGKLVHRHDTTPNRNYCQRPNDLFGLSHTEPSMGCRACCRYRLFEDAASLFGG